MQCEVIKYCRAGFSPLDFDFRMTANGKRPEGRSTVKAMRLA